MTLPGERDLPCGDRTEPALPPIKHELPSQQLARWLRLIGRATPELMLVDRRRPDPTPFEDRLERIWQTGETREPGQEG